MIKTAKKKYELFETEWLVMRQNPGGTSPIVQGYLLGFVGTVNLEGVVNPTTKKAGLLVKVGNGDTQYKEIDFTGCDLKEVTVAEAVEALNYAGFDDCEFTVDEETKRLKLAPEDPGVRFIQIYGDLAAALNFGNCRIGEGKGCYLFASFDGDLKSLAETENWDEDKKIENDSPLGRKVTVTIPGKRGSTQIVITDRVFSDEAKQMINGGIWKEGDADTLGSTEPSVGDGGITRNVDVLTYSRLVDTYETNIGNEAFILERMYIGGVGRAKQSGGAGTMKDSEYTLTFGTYTGKDGEEHASPKQTKYSRSQWDAANLRGIIELDWADLMAQNKMPVTGVPVTGVFLDTKNIVLKIDGTRQLVAIVTPSNADNKNVTWESGDENIATVDASGLVKGIAVGTAEVIVTTEDGDFDDICDIEVEI